MRFSMKKFYWLVACLLLWVTPAANAQHRSKMKKGNSEQGLVNRIDACLVNEDPYCYMDIFPDIDTLSKLVMLCTEPTSKDYHDMAMIQQFPGRMFQADSIFRSRVKQMFDDVIAQGKEQGVHWSSMIPVRYELVKARETRNRTYEKLAPTRFTGYVFMTDVATRRTFGFTVSEMLQINEEWYGGYLGPIFEAGTRDEYEDARIAAKRKKKMEADTAKIVVAADKDDDEDRENSIQKMIAERKLYTGMFDNEIPVQLYVRSLKGTCKEGICAWEAIYKFGDQDDYILLTVARTEDGKWTFTEVPPTGSMDLVLKAGKYTGNWTAADNQTGYEVKLTEVPASTKKIERLEAAFLELRKTKKE